MTDQDVDELLEFMRDGPGDPTWEQAQQALMVAESVVNAYCRGNAKDGDGLWREGVWAVVLMVAARVLANPAGIQYRDQAGPFSVSRQSGFEGFTLGERFVLNRYRKSSK